MRHLVKQVRNAPKQLYILLAIAIVSLAMPVALHALSSPVLTVSKQVRIAGTTEWKKAIVAKPGDTVEYRVTYTNTSDRSQFNVTLRDTMDKGLVYTPNSALLNSAKLSDKIVEQTGESLGNYEAKSTATISYRATVAAKEHLACGTTTLKNLATVSIENAAVRDGATITVTNECQGQTQNQTQHQAQSSAQTQPNQNQPVYTCDALNIDRVSHNDFKFSIKYTALRGASVKKTTYVVYDAAKNEVYNSDKKNFKGFAPGTHTAKAFLTVVVNGQEKVISSDACEKSFTIAGQPAPNTPTPPQKSSIKIEATVNSSKHSTIQPNVTFTYLVKVTNSGESTLKNIAITDTAPEGIAFSKASVGALTTTLWQHTIPELKAGQSATFELTARAVTGATGSLKNTVCADTPDIPNTPDSCDNATVEITKTQTPATPTPPQKPSKPSDSNTPSQPSTPQKPSNPNTQSTPSTPNTAPSQQQQHQHTSNTSSGQPAPNTASTQPNTTPSPVDNASDTATASSVPVAELPRTGAVDIVLSSLGLSALATAGFAYIASRKQ